jgi:hypothetical protein
MAKINDGTLRDWNNGDKLTSEGYEQDREIIRVAVNDNADRVGSLEGRTSGVEGRMTTAEGDIDVLQAADITHNNRLSSLEEYEPVQDQRLTDLEYNVTGTVVPRTFQELGMQNTTFDDIKLGYIDKQVEESMNVTVPAQLQALQDSYSPRLGAVETYLADIVTDVKLYGAKGDGVTDDTTAINNALSALNTNGGGVLYFPKGTYIISSSITSYSKITWRGTGKNSIIKLNAFRIPIVLADDNILEFLTFDGNSTSLGSDDQTVNSTINPIGSRILIHDCYFKNAVGSNMSSGNGIDVIIKNNIFDGYVDHAIYFSSSSTRILIEGNIIHGNSVGGEAIKFRNGVTDAIVKNNIADSVNAFINITADPNPNKNIIVVGNKASTVAHSFLLSRTGTFLNDNVIFDGNMFENIGSYTALSLKWSGKVGVVNIKIVNNTFKNYKDMGDYSGDDDLTNYLENVDFLNNTIIIETGKAVTNGYMFNSNYNKKVMIVGNKIKSAVSQAAIIRTIGTVGMHIRDNHFDLPNPTNFFALNNSADVVIEFTGNKVVGISRRLITGEVVTGASLIKIIRNDITCGETNYPYFYDRSLVTAPTMYLPKDNVVNGVSYIDKSISYIPSYLGQISIVGSVVYIATGTSATTDWKQVS